MWTTNYTVRILIILQLAIAVACNEKTEVPKTILVVVPHPDDETAFTPTLSAYSRMGAKVYMIVGVDGRFTTKIKASNPDSLALLNKAEVRCSCNKLGVEPIFFDFVSLDRKHGAKDGVRASVETGNQFKEKLKETLAKINPDLIITYDVNGEYGHPEHIVVSGLVTELLLREGLVDKYPLYYFGWKKSLEEGNDGWVRYSDDGYFNVVVRYDDEDERRSVESLKCYSGFSEEEKTEIIEFERNRPNELFFRKFVVAVGVKEGF